MNENVLIINDHEFTLAPLEGVRATAGPITLKKPRWMVDRYIEIAASHQGAAMVELGLWDGGSTAFLASAFRPSALLGFELETRPLDALDRFLEDFEGSEAVHVELGVDQTDTATLRERISHHISGPLDVVVDDASHLLHQTTVSFDCLFPLIRPGGLFIIEDWSHEHQLAFGIRKMLASGQISANDLGNPSDAGIPDTPLSRLIIDIMLATANADGIVDDIRVRQGFAEVRRGDTELDPDNFSIRGLIGELGRKISPRPDGS